jgi:hypothetical protein
VTGLGEFSPIGRLFTLCSFLKMTEVAQIFQTIFAIVKVSYILTFTNGLGYIIGDLFTNSSGHLGSSRVCGKQSDQMFLV